MNNLLTAAKDEPRADTRVLAELLGNQHQTVFELVKGYKIDFEQLGLLRFQTGKANGGRPERFALLNEDQCYLLLTFSRNTAKVRSLKVKLVQAFKEARANRNLTDTEYLPTYHALHDEIHRLADGSPNERFVHMNVNKAINKALGIDSGTRGEAGLPFRSLLVVAQMAAASAMKGSADHHDGYTNAKAAIARLAAVISAPSAPKLQGA